MSDSDLLEKLHRTWVQALINDCRNDYAAIIVDAELEFDVEWSEYYSCDYNSGIIVYLPLNLRLIVSNSDEIQQTLRHYFMSIAGGHI
ncbi:hypothetical protein [Nostoc sp.]|uniref:hypothetical protein n=1 Tax=Nostoc sp. TaxID=1180 RepID=UPI002FFC82E6